mgnify:CR=1 FL=1
MKLIRLNKIIDVADPSKIKDYKLMGFEEFKEPEKVVVYSPPIVNLNQGQDEPEEDELEEQTESSTEKETGPKDKKNSRKKPPVTEEKDDEK